VLQVGRYLDLTQETLDPNDGAEVGLQDLQRDAAIVPDIAGEVYRRHPTFPDEPFNGVSAIEGGVELVGRVHSNAAVENETKVPPGSTGVQTA
jgi:hypothetical protein